MNERPDTATLRRIAMRVQDASDKPDLTIDEARGVLGAAASVLFADADMIDLLWSMREQ